MQTLTVSSKYQIVIPSGVRERLRIQPGAKLMVVELGGSLRLVPVEPAAALRGIARGIDTTLPQEPDRLL